MAEIEMSEVIEHYSRVADGGKVSQETSHAPVAVPIIVAHLELLIATAKRAQLWECPDCNFAFSATHKSQDGTYHCPVCAEFALQAKLKTAEEHNALRAQDIVTLGLEVGKLTTQLKEAEAAISSVIKTADIDGGTLSSKSWETKCQHMIDVAFAYFLKYPNPNPSEKEEEQ